MEQEDGVNPRYPNTEQDFIVAMMHSLPTPTRWAGTSFSPCWRRWSSPPCRRSWSRTTLCAASWNTTPLLPAAVLHNFIVHMQSAAVRELTWRRGTVLRQGSCCAMVRFGKNNSIVEIVVSGPPDEAAAYRHVLADALKRAHEDLDLTYQEAVLYRQDGRQALVDLQRSVNILAQGKAGITSKGWTAM